MNKPKIRFKGYTDAWERRKLGECIELESGRDYKHLSNGNIPVYGTGGYMLSVNSALSYKDGIGIGRKGTIDKPFVLKAPFWTVDTLFYALPHNNELNFLYSIFQKIDWKRYDESTGVPSLSKVAIKDIRTYITTLSEQRKIGAFFRGLDELIALHQRKYEKLQKVKKSFLEKMFPAEGESKPRIRFKGYTDAWERRKLGECGEFKSNGVDKKIRNNEVPVNLLNYMDVYNGLNITSKNCGELMQVTAKIKQVHENNVLKNDVFFTPSSETPDDIGRVNVIEEDLDNTVYSYHLVRFRPHTNIFYSIFPKYAFSHDCIRKQMILAAQGVQRFVINRSGFEELNADIPSYSEQAKIGAFFRELDELIALHQRKLNKLKNIKKSFLEKMFPSE